MGGGAAQELLWGCSDWLERFRPRTVSLSHSLKPRVSGPCVKLSGWTMRRIPTCVKIPIVPVSRFRVLLVIRECNSFKILIMQLTDRFIDSCNRADDFPKNLIGNETFIEYNLIDYHERLNYRASELFSPDDEGYLRFWEYDDENQSKPMHSTELPPRCR